MSDRYFTSEKKYFSIESVGEQFKALRAFKSIKDGATEQSEETKVFDNLKDAEKWVQGE